MADYPPPLIIPPRILPHNQTFILLHGRGSSGDKFGPPWKTLATIFPHARFVFPTAARRRATIYRRSRISQWFDNWALDAPPAPSVAVAAERDALQLPGLRETTAHIHALLRAEIAIVGGDASRIVLGGLSQGCAAALVAMLLWEGPPLGAVVGMCGWLPFAGGLVDAAATSTKGGPGGAGNGVDGDLEEGGEEGDDGDDFFDRGEEDEGEEAGGSEGDGPGARALRWFREELELPRGLLVDGVKAAGSESLHTPVFLGHGVEDDRVSVDLGRNAAVCLESLGVQTVGWREYMGLGHWYSGQMLQDMVGFLERSSNITLD